MKIKHLRNATFVVESFENYILIDPMLSKKGVLPPFAHFRHKPLKNPIVNLPENSDKILNGVTTCLVTHSQKLGVKALQHTDHLDSSGEAYLKDRNIPVVTGSKDSSYLMKKGLNVVKSLNYWEPVDFLGGKITAVPAIHGHGFVKRIMANGAGFFIELPGEPSIYVSGDTLYTKDVKKALREYKPDIAVMASGGASLDIGGPILMPLSELIAFAGDAPNIVVANHLEALNHCPISRKQLKTELEKNGLRSKVMIPDDGEILTF